MQKDETYIKLGIFDQKKLTWDNGITTNTPDIGLISTAVSRVLDEHLQPQQNDSPLTKEKVDSIIQQLDRAKAKAETPSVTRNELKRMIQGIANML